MNIAIVIFDNFTDLDLFVLWDLLKRVESPDWTVKILGEKKIHVSSTGIEIKTHGSLSEANESDAVIFCSGQGTRVKMKDEEFLSSFNLDESKQLLGALDSGALLLGALGFLKGRTVTSYPSPEIKRSLEAMGAVVEWKTFIEEGNIATAAQCFAGANLVGWVIEKFVGAEESKRVLSSALPLDEVNLRV
jgi:transcriptional regulator GlxA family with amidase domain